MFFNRQKISIIAFVLLLIVSYQNFTYVNYEVAYDYESSTVLKLSTVVASSAGLPGDKNVIIRNGTVVYVDQSVDVGSLMIEPTGQLHCDSDKAQDVIEIKAKNISVNGLFQCGTKNNRYLKNLTISLKHDSSLDPKETNLYRALNVSGNGKLILTGSNRNTTWYKISEHLNKDTRELLLPSSVAGKWSQLDRVVVAPTSYDLNQVEEFLVDSVSVDGRTVTLNKNALYKHWGRPQVINALKNGTKILNQSAEVANLTRNIKIQSDASHDPNVDQLGGHVMIMGGGFAAIDSVEFYKMGQAGIMARYPFHWHQQMAAGENQFIKNSSIVNSFQRCLTIHRTYKTLVENNVCYNFRGHGIFLEDGTEKDNIIRTNLIMDARYPLPGKSLLASDVDSSVSGVVNDRFPAVSSFWISNPQNEVYGNVAAGSVGTGFWMSFVPQVKDFYEDQGGYEGIVLASPITANTTVFRDNTAHTTQVGITWDGAPDHSANLSSDHRAHKSFIDNPNNTSDRKILQAHYAPSGVRPFFGHLKAYKNIQTGIYFRGQTAFFTDAMLADNGWSLFMAYNQIIRNSVVVGRSENHSDQDDEFLYTIQKKFLRKQAGVVLYDGPFELDTVDFVDFATSAQTKTVDGKMYDVTTVPIFQIGGAEKFVNITKNLSFTPEPLYRVYGDDISTFTWIDSNSQTEIRDLDGTLTGTANGLVTRDDPFNLTESCQQDSKLFNFKKCGAAHNKMSLLFFSNRKIKIPFVTVRSDQKLSISKDRWQLLDDVKDESKYVYHNKVGLLGAGFDYTIIFRKKDLGIMGLQNLRVLLNGEKLNTVSPVVKIVGLGSVCTLVGATKLTSLSALRLASSTSFYSAGNDFYIKLKTTLRNSKIVPHLLSYNQEQVTPEFRISCAAPTASPIVGAVGRVYKDPVSYLTKLEGWACQYGEEAPINVHLYAGGAFGAGGTLVKATLANRASEPGVNQACGALGVGYRYLFEFTELQLQALQNKTIFVHGVPFAGSNALLSNSGVLRFPALINTNVKGHIDTVTRLADGSLEVSGWACNVNRVGSINIHMYVQGAAGSGTFVKAELADRTTEANVRTACGVASGNYRFLVRLTAAERLLHRNKPIYIHGLSSVGGANNLLDRSGLFRIP